jgi:hypothetical protein
MVPAVADNEINAQDLQKQESEKIKIPPYEKKNVTHREAIF